MKRRETIERIQKSKHEGVCVVCRQLEWFCECSSARTKSTRSQLAIATSGKSSTGSLPIQNYMVPNSHRNHSNRISIFSMIQQTNRIVFPPFTPPFRPSPNPPPPIRRLSGNSSFGNLIPVFFLILREVINHNHVMRYTIYVQFIV